MTHVYSVGYLAADAAEYTHMAGRTGRVGQGGGGVVTSLLRDEEQIAVLRGIVEAELGATLFVGASRVNEGVVRGEESDEEMRRRLDDSLMLDVDEGPREDE